MLKILAIILYLVAINTIICEEISSSFNIRLKRSNSCGASKTFVGMLFGGNYFARGKYPWMVALMNNNNRLTYFCGGVLISNKKVLSAAHCIHPKGGRRKLPQDIKILLGVHNLTEIHEVDRIAKTPNKIFIHPDWNSNTVNYDADISVLVFENEIHFTDLIQPICLWTSDVDPIATQGVIIGYGKSEDETREHETTPKELKMPIIRSNEQCFIKVPALINLSSERTFCAGSADGSGPCLGDSGHGLFIIYRNIFYLRGLVSSSLRTAFTCDTSKYAVFTNVLKFKNWIENPSSELESYIPQSTQIPIDESICGLMSQSAGLIQGGKRSKRNQFPWMAIIKRLKENKWIHSSSGCLITKKHIIANSLFVSYHDSSNKLIPIEANEIKILLGATKVDNSNEAGLQEADVLEIKNHPNARKILPSFDIMKISIITLNREIKFTEFIRPVCLWTGEDDDDEFNEDAYAVGYGSDYTGRDSLTRKHVHVTITDEDADCRNTFSQQLKFKHETKLFCVKNDKNEGPCKRDSLLFVKYDANWYLKGIKSTSNIFYNGTCNNQKPILFEDIASFVPWILNEI